MLKSRREFLRLVAAGSAAALTANTRSVAAAAKRATKRVAKPAADTTKTAAASAATAPSAAIPPAIRAEIEKQKKSTLDALKVIREYPMSAGSPMAFSFAAMRSVRQEGRKS
jgi:hypothetical protein